MQPNPSIAMQVSENAEDVRRDLFLVHSHATVLTKME